VTIKILEPSVNVGTIGFMLSSSTTFTIVIYRSVDDFRTANWVEIIKYPELVYQKSQQFLFSIGVS